MHREGAAVLLCVCSAGGTGVRIYFEARLVVDYIIQLILYLPASREVFSLRETHQSAFRRLLCNGEETLR